VADGVRNRDKCARDLEIVLKTEANVAGSVENENIVGLSGGFSIVVEVVDDCAGALGRNGNSDLVEEGGERGRDRSRGGHCQKNVSAGIDELDDQIRGQIGT
jgi:hypothetical protein